MVNIVAELQLRNLERCFPVERINDPGGSFYVYFCGPKGSLYHGRTWKIRVDPSYFYPYKIPELQFVNHICHPSIDPVTGRVCNSCMIKLCKQFPCELLEIFAATLPHLLMQPMVEELCLHSEADPLFRLDEGRAYGRRVKDYRGFSANTKCPWMGLALYIVILIAIMSFFVPMLTIQNS